MLEGGGAACEDSYICAVSCVEAERRRPTRLTADCGGLNRT